MLVVFKGFGSWVSGIKDVWIILVLINNMIINFKKKSVFSILKKKVS
jgi:hypothetical protein